MSEVGRRSTTGGGTEAAWIKRGRWQQVEE
ncbi:hypothetical protein A2U01_0095409, partial [Trifolium medium]|nr:hypothetical protein [Trifolium medium]